jgi:hypothetical protein
MISETVENSAGLKKTGGPAFGPTGSIRKVSVSPSLKAGNVQFEDRFHRGLPLLPPDLSEDPDSRAGRRRGGQGREAPGPTLARWDGGWQVSSHLNSLLGLCT